MKKIRVVQFLFVVLLAGGLYGGMLAYNTSCNQGNGSIFIKNVEALADNDQEDDWVWDEILGYFIPVIHDPYKAPIF